MACIGCENFAKRISNAYRDEEIKNKYESIVGYEITSDAFICDDCSSKLDDAVAFRDKCRKTYESLNPNVKIKVYAINDLLIEENEDPAEEQHELETIYESPETNRGVKRPQTRVKKETNNKKPKTAAGSSSDFSEFVIVNSTPNNEAAFEEDESYDDLNQSKPLRKSWTVAQKLDIIEYAESHTNRDAARYFQMNESTVRSFRKQKATLQTMQPDRSTNRHGTAYWPLLEESLKNWVKLQKTKPKMNEIRSKALELSKSFGYENFTGSTSYIFKFMQRNGIDASSPRPRKNFKAEKPSFTVINETVQE